MQLIDRGAVIDEILGLTNTAIMRRDLAKESDDEEAYRDMFIQVETFLVVTNLLYKSPIVDAVKHGEWIKHSIHENVPWGFDCSICKEWFVVDSKFIGRYKYCPNCGAKMDGKEQEDE